jgi:hypothetical protein
MNLYLISQGVNKGYDTYDSAVVAVKNEEEARNTKPHSRYEEFSCNGAWAIHQMMYQ